MEKLLITIVVLAIPAYFYTGLVNTIDRFEKEPTRYLIAAFAWGAFPAIIFAVILQLIFAIPVAEVFGEKTLGSQLMEASVGAPVTEEFLKGIAVAIIYWTRRHEFDGWVDGIVYGATAGFGFAYVENIFYLMGTETWEDWGTLLILRTVVFGGLHGFWSALVGMGFGLARYQHNFLVKIVLISGGLLTAMLGHLIHNGAVTLVEVTEGSSFLVALLNYGLLILLIVALWFIGGFVEHRKLKQYLADEVPQVISSECYQGICAPRSSQLKSLGIHGKHKKALLQVAGELAQKKLQLQKMGEEQDNSQRIAQLRTELQRLSRLQS